MRMWKTLRKYAEQGGTAPWFVKEEFQHMFEELCDSFPMPGDLDKLRAAFSDGKFLKTADWMALAGDAGRYLLRKVLGIARISQTYIDLFMEIFCIMEELQRTFFSNQELRELRNRIIEVATYREMLLPLSYSSSLIHHTLLHAVDTIIRHGPCTVTWNFAAERQAGALKRGIWSFKGVQSSILKSDAILFEGALREATKLHREGKPQHGEFDADPLRAQQPSASSVAEKHNTIRKGLQDSLHRSAAAGAASDNAASIFLPQGRQHFDDILGPDSLSRAANSFFPLRNPGEKKSKKKASPLDLARDKTDSLHQMLINMYAKDYPEQAARADDAGHSREIILHDRMYFRGVLIRTTDADKAFKTRSSGFCAKYQTADGATKLAAGEVQKIIRWRVWNREDSPWITVLGALWATKPMWDSTMRRMSFTLDWTEAHNCSGRLVNISNWEPVNVQYYNPATNSRRKFTEGPTTRFDAIFIQRGIKNKRINGIDDFYVQ